MAEPAGRQRLPRFAASVAKGVHLALLKQALEGLDAAERAGTVYSEAGPALASRLRADWLGPTAPRLVLTADNAAGQAEALGRMTALSADTDRRPFWYFSAVLDDRVTETCFECDGVLLPSDHPWWGGHIAPLHARCRSAITAVTAAQARAMGGPTARPPAVEVEEGFGTLDSLCSWEPRPGEYPAELHEPFFPAADGRRSLSSASTSATPMPLSSARTKAKANRPLTPKQRREARAAKARAAADAAAVKAAGLNPSRRRGLHMRIGLAADGGPTIEVMHAADGAAGGVTVRGEGCELAVLLADAAAAPTWNQLTRLGAWRGHPAGPFEITRETNAEIVRNFRATQNQRIPIDFEHASEADATAGTIPTEGAPAQAWIVDLEDRGAEGLWGLVEFLEPALTYVREKKYRFFSPAIRFGSRDRVTARPIGARMTSGALTNIPFLDGLMPLAAADRTSLGVPMINQAMMSDDFHRALRAALRLDDTALLEKCAEKCADLRAHCSMADESMMSQGVDLRPYMMGLKTLMNMPEHSTLGQILDAVEDMIEAAIERHEAVNHAGDGDDEGPPSSEGEGEGTNMSDTNTLAVQLGEEKQKNSALTTERTTLMAERDRLATEAAALGLRLKDAEARAATALADVATAEAALVALKAQVEKRDAEEQEARVTLAFDTYKDARKLNDADKRAMRITLRSDPALFAELYPPVAPNQRHLMADLTGKRTADTTQSTASGESRKGMSAADQRALSDKYVKEGLSLEQATTRAYLEAKAAATNARN